MILLFAGIILGGIWADASWGRFWGWDPKETWAFLTWLVFVVVIHGRWSGWLRDFGTAVGGVVGGLSLLMTYYGVNFFLSGLHSYAGREHRQRLVPGLARRLALVRGSAPHGRRAPAPLRSVGFPTTKVFFTAEGRGVPRRNPVSARLRGSPR